jgi:hypothetical protein
MCSKKEWKAAAERRLAENLALRMLVEQLDQILNKPSDDLAQAKRLIRRARRKVAVAKEIGK